MIIYKDKEKQDLYEMAIRVISWPEDGLPFDICIMDPETSHKDAPHAHLFEPKKGGKDMGMRLALFPAMPRTIADIRDAFPGRKNPIPEEWKRIILVWARTRNKVIPEISNWRDLWSQWIHSLSKR
jgi:hypothetical protein